MVIYIQKNEPVLAKIIYQSGVRSIDFVNQNIVMGDYYVSCLKLHGTIYEIRVLHYVMINGNLQGECVYEWIDEIRSTLCFCWWSKLPEQLDGFDDDTVID